MNSDLPLDRSTIFLSGFAPKRLNLATSAAGNGRSRRQNRALSAYASDVSRSDLVSVIQGNSRHVQALLVALRDKNASNGIPR